MTKRKDGRWQETITVNGKTHYFYGKTKAEVLRKISDYREEQKHGAAFDKVADEWWEQKEQEIEWNSRKAYYPAYKRAIAEFEQKPIGNIRPVDIARYLEDFAERHAQKTVNTQKQIFGHIFSYAVSKGYIDNSPMRDLITPKAAKAKKEVLPPSADELAAIARTSDTFIGRLFLWAALTGMRRGELLALEWNDVDLDNRVIHITKSLHYPNGKPTIKKPKTAKSLSDIPILEELYTTIDKPKHNGIVFCNRRGGYLTEGQYQNALKHYRRECSVTLAAHQLRHGFATALFDAEIKPEEMQILLRHAQLSTTMDVYRAIGEKRKNAVFDSVKNVKIMSQSPQSIEK